MSLTPHLSFDGRCAEAFKFYEKSLGGKIVQLMTHGESPARANVPADWQEKVIHARIEIDGQTLMGMDAPPPHYAKPQGIFVSLSLGTEARARNAFDALAEGGCVTMPFQETFFSSGFGMVTDRFGIPWMINTERAA